jgi:hypothetical protein
MVLGGKRLTRRRRNEIKDNAAGSDMMTTLNDYNNEIDCEALEADWGADHGVLKCDSGDDDDDDNAAPGIDGLISWSLVSGMATLVLLVHAL